MLKSQKKSGQKENLNLKKIKTKRKKENFRQKNLSFIITINNNILMQV